ncbi:MAG: NAD(P)-dependent dehydrogenase (short-subunit alcohol dehydrogenase family) [Candidatus Endobugula sp.]|jgi:NAD(P)-dependent dehydrogenase (short-subunit alcohol dehydrogenase family)
MTDAKQLEGLHVVVVGASGGIGQALIDQLAHDTHVNTIYGLSRHEYIPSLSTAVHYQHLAIDYSDESSIAQAATQLPKVIDKVIVATGFLHDDQLRPEKSFKQISPENITQNMLVNMIGPSLIAKHFLPKMRGSDYAVFAALSARVGSIGDNQLGGWYSYRASKAALNMMIKTFSVELKRSQPKTTIIGLHPGTVNTALSEPFQRNVPEGKLFTRDYSAARLLEVINKVGVEDSGYCYAWDGQRIAE